MQEEMSFLEEIQRKAKRISDDVTLADIAYLAGIIDGEGTIGSRRTGPEPYTAYVLYLQIANTDYRLMRWCEEKFGAKIQHGGKRQKEHHKQGWAACWYASYAKEVIRLIEPYLKLKHEQALIALDFPTDKSRVPEKRQRLFLALRELNKKGCL